MSKLNFNQIYAESLLEPNKFWLQAAGKISWFEPPIAALNRVEENAFIGNWFRGGKLNTCFNALDVHVANGFGEQTALIYESPVSGQTQRFTFKQLLAQVATFAGALKAKGVSKGDRVVIYMPMIPQAVVAMLACARIGAIHSVVFGGFASKELAVRIDDAEPKVVLTASCGLEGNKVIDYKALLNQALQLSQHKPDFQVIFQREQLAAQLDYSGDIGWVDFVANAQPAECEPLDASDPLYILYTSGTTGKPKGVVRDNGGHCVALKWSMQNIYNMNPGETFWAASDIGWVVGHSYIVYGPLINRNTTVLFEGKPVGTPDSNVFWKTIEKHQVKTLFTAPTAIRAIKKLDPQGKLMREAKCDLSCLEALFLAGERSDADTLQWSVAQLKVPVIDHWWQTETGWSICANCLGIEQLPIVLGSPTKAVAGYELAVLDKNGQPIEQGKIGALAIKTPLPPGTFIGLWKDQVRFKESYFKRFAGYYETGDAGFIDENGYVFVMSRTDDIINVAGHRLSTGAIEEVIAGHPDVAECAVIGIPCDLKGEIPVALLVLNEQCQASSAEIQSNTVQLVRDKLGAVYSYKSAVVIDALPKTRSGKVLRSTMKKIARHQKYEVPATIDNPDSLSQVSSALAQL
ncbi:propionyl-CoA synthetase [Aliikangiella marina]|uniref:Propionyl-CoA synthetase n=1 Tax=Aliikangiella marina TaxID=1712262 RepID=A0A545TI19_9GAMM|nr:AMP-binding protein [Aliikangiella marina]TQV76811.1 propionyl-CoA synthetase [Aliikangiella marina]